MRWKYYIATQEHPTGRWDSVDVYLKPETAGPTDVSIWLTFSTPGFLADLKSDAAIKAAIRQLGGKPYILNPEGGLVAAAGLSKPDVLRYADMWFREHGHACTGLEAGACDEFAGTNGHARVLEELGLIKSGM